MVNQLEDMYGYLVDTNPANNGSLVGSGFYTDQDPSGGGAAVNLYVHMPSGVQALKKAR